MLPEQQRRKIRITRRNILELAALAPLSLLPPPEREPLPRPTLGFYLPFHFLPTERVMKPFKKLLLTSGANTIVVDIKNEYGLINVPFEHAFLPKTAIKSQYVKGLESLLLWAEANDVSIVGRQVVMLDSKLVLAHPKLGLSNKSGGAWKDTLGNYWASPFDERVVDYNATIAEAAASYGIKKVQFDYVRFPSGEQELKSIYYPKANTFANRTGAITAFFKAAQPRVNAYGTALTADFFGYTAWPHQKDMGIGQYIESAGYYLDGLSPMAYPSLYGSGIIDPCPDACKPPTAHPYEIVFNTVEHTLERLRKVNPNGFVEPWIQAYPDTRFGQHLGLAQFEAQQLAALTAGASGVMAWDPTLKYHPDFYKSLTN